MAKFYTPGHLVDFKPMPSDAQRLVDTMKEIKTEKREDEKYETEKRKAELAYKEGMYNFQVAKMKMDDLAREQQLDQEASQIFNSIMSSGGSRTDGLKAVATLMLQKGGWGEYNKFLKDLKGMITEGLEIAKINPKAAQGVAEMINVNFPADQQITGEQLAQRLASSEAVKIDNEGNFAQIDPNTGELKVVNLASPEMKAAAEREAALEERKMRVSEMNARTNANRVAEQATAALDRLQSRKEIETMKDATKREIEAARVALRTRKLESELKLKEAEQERKNAKDEVSRKVAETKIDLYKKQIEKIDAATGMAEKKFEENVRQFDTVMGFKERQEKNKTAREEKKESKASLARNFTVAMNSIKSLQQAENQLSRNNLLATLSILNIDRTGDDATDMAAARDTIQQRKEAVRQTVAEIEAVSPEDARILKAAAPQVFSAGGTTSFNRLQDRVNRLRGSAPAPSGPADIESEWGQLLPTDVRNQGY